MIARYYKAFTLVELIIVIAVLAILVAISAAGMTQSLQGARDSGRETNITAITDALEKYYAKNGEYPNCSQMTQSASNLSSLLDINTDIVTSPKSGGANAIICSSLSSSSGDNYSYVGDNCQGNEQCLGWTMQYKKEKDGSIVTFKSRNNGSIATSGTTQLTLTVDSPSQISLSWIKVPNATNYRVERSTSSTMSSPTTSTVQGLSTSASGLISGKRYYFRVTPYVGADIGKSATGNEVTSIAPPSGTVSAAVNLVNGDAQVTVSASGVTCASGTTLQYALGISSGRVRTSDSSAVVYGSWTTTSSQTSNAFQGKNYIASAKARCQGSDATSSEVVATSTPNVTRSIIAPASPVYGGDVSWAAGYRYLMQYSKFTTYCPADTWVADSTIGLYRNGATSRRPTTGYYNTTSTQDDPYVRYLGWDVGEYAETVTYYASYACKTDFTTSSRSNEGGGAVNVSVYCESARRSGSANPRCDDQGRDVNSLPLGP